MNRHLHSPTKLTEFARDFDEEPATFVTKFVNKIQTVYNTGYNSVNELPVLTDIPNTTAQSKSDSPDKISVGSVESLSSSSTSGTTLSKSVSEVCEPDNQTEAPIGGGEDGEGRTMYNVLKRISKIVASKNSENLRNYKETDLHRFWMPDSKAKECYDCTSKFSTFRRKHHCRLCGQIFCSKCCNQVVPGKIIMCSEDLKVCNYCSKIVLSYLNSPDTQIDIKTDLQALHEEISTKLSLNSSSTGKIENLAPERPISLARKISVGYQEERFIGNQPNSLSNADRKTILQQSNSLKTLYEEMTRLLPSQNCGTDLIDYLNNNHKSSNKVQAIAILNAMLEAGFLTPIVSDSEQIDFDEILHYKFAQTSDLMSNLMPPNHDFGLETEAGDELQPPSLVSTNSNYENDNSMFTSKTTSQLLESYCNYEEHLVSQLLRSNNLEQSWAKDLIPLCARAVNQFRPEYCSNDLMDIRHYVNIKKVPGGQRSDSNIIGGVVFSKNVAHKSMPTDLQHPRILLLQCPIMYERIEGKFVSISTVLLQEKEYLRNVTARIMSLKPNVVLVHKTVAGIAQDMLRDFGVTLIMDVKTSVLERLARCLQCDILTSVESNIGKPKLGLCDHFYIKSFDDGYGSSKTLMYFEKFSNPRGYNCLLRGASNAELTKVKKVASFLIYARYNWRLEMSFLLDEFAQPLVQKPIMFDSKEQSPLESYTKTPSEFNNPPKRLIERKSEEKLLSEHVSDCSDPLRAQLSPVKYDGADIELSVETPYDNRFRAALSTTVLSVSPFVSFPLPYLETESGRKCSLRSHFPNELFFSKQWSSNTDRVSFNESHLQIKEVGIQLNPPHPFVTHKITTPIDNKELQTMLAEFRAYGGRYPRSKVLNFFKRKEIIQMPQKAVEDHIYNDALDLINHQRLPVLFCSFYYNPKAASSICAPPTLLDMKFYGQQDIMLGQFLERYCFCSSYICPSCNLPMMGHVRRYVHSMGCVQVFLTQDPNVQNDSDKIFLTSRCLICHTVTPNVAISETTKNLSFAKYLELRFHGHAYRKRAVEDIECNKCTHSLHRDYIHYFSSKGVRATFRYTPIEVWEIGLPPFIIHLQKPKPLANSQVLEEIKIFSVKGYEVYSKIHERIADLATEEGSSLVNQLKMILNEDQFIFRQHVEIVQTLLTESAANSYDLNDAMIMAKKALAESIEIWGPRLHKASLMAKHLQKQEVDPVMICTDDLKPDVESPNSTEVRNVSEDFDIKIKDNKNFDKKSIKNLISQMLPSTSNDNPLTSPIPHSEHLTLPKGSIPITVNDNDPSSVIAYSIVSSEYKKAIELLNGNSSDIIGSSPNLNRKSKDSEDFDEKEEDKKNKVNSHIEVSFNDSTCQFTCLIYFANEFDYFRANIMKPPKIDRNLYKELREEKNLEGLKVNSNHEIEVVRKSASINLSDESKDSRSIEIEEIREHLARSLSKSLQWEAKGGKSGSKFNKTVDERFVLKEMSKGDLSIFENFAPNYFEYMNKCLVQNKPTLLAKILGVFKVLIKKKDSVQEYALLVMENLFYGAEIKNKFDLKGSERNRHVNPLNHNGNEEIVLLDENLIQMSWSKPLYILSHSKTILRDAIIRDASFLEKNDVMDYSLLVGLDTKERVLVIGIIDYIRTYTFDKRLESFVKQSGILGGQGKLPTVISPQRYKQRFIEAMDRYFYSVPDRWEGLSTK